jgi:antirestriction protein ArdC
MEELVAELGSAFLCADLDLTPEIREDHAAYIASWLEVLKNDKRAIFSAAAQARKAADFFEDARLNQSYVQCERNWNHHADRSDRKPF